MDRFNQGNGAVQRLISDQQYANQLLNNLQVSLADMKDILRKIDDGQGSIGLAVNDPSLYHDAKNFLGGSGSMGWGMKMLNGLYGVTHPFHRRCDATFNRTDRTAGAILAAGSGIATMKTRLPHLTSLC